MKELVIPFQINSTCNLKCPFCYLEEMPRTEVTTGGIDVMLSLGQHTYVCIGKEPTLSPEVLAHFLTEGKRLGVRTGIITNGILLGRFFTRYPDTHVNNVDVTYHAGDDVHWQEDTVRVSVEVARQHCDTVNVLFVLHKGTQRTLGPAISFAEEIGAQCCMVSPMTPTKRVVPYGYELQFPELDDFYRMLRSSSGYMDSSITRTVVDDYHYLEAGQRPATITQVQKHAASYGLSKKVVAIGDPLRMERPVMDVEIGGGKFVALHPLARLNTAQGISDKFPTVMCSDKTGEDVYQELLKRSQLLDPLAMLASTQ